MSDRRLQVFHTVAKTLSFTKAAKLLHMTQPAVTFQVQQLEEHFNTRLFNRVHHRISLTEAGKNVYEYADKIFTIYARMENRIRDMTNEPLHALTLGTSKMVAEYMLPPLLKNIKRLFPNAAIQIQVANTNEIVSMVEYNEIDLGVVEAPVTNKKLVAELWYMDRLVLVVPPGHDLSGKNSVMATDLTAYPYIIRREGLGIIRNYLKSRDLDVDNLDIATELDSFEAVKGAIEAGMGISLLPHATLTKELALGLLIAIDPKPALQQSFFLVHQKQRFLVPDMGKLHIEPVTVS